MTYQPSFKTGPEYERDLADLRAERDQARRDLNEAVNERDALESALDEARNGACSKADMEYMREKLAAVTVERDEEKRKLRTICYDVDYVGGVQYWQTKATDAAINALKVIEPYEALLVERDTAFADLSASQQEARRLSKIADALLNHCDKEGGECSECGKIVCPHGEPLHFHHDGCPACAQHESGEPK